MRLVWVSIVVVKSAGKTVAMAEKNPHAVALGRKGGKARLTTMTPERRIEIAKKAIQARWAKAKEELDRMGDGIKKFERRSNARQKKIDKLLKIAKGKKSNA
jgi:hypothetical protein